jgi:hypothetical protein
VWRTWFILLFAAVMVKATAVSAQRPLTLEEAMKRAQGETADARALASAIDEADARIQGNSRDSGHAST